MLYLPVQNHPEGGQFAIVRDLADGRAGLLAYTALDRLADKCGAKQPWMLIATANLGTVKEVQPFDVVLFDIDIPVALRADEQIA